MAALGPNVGRAHVTVGMKAQTDDIKVVGKQIHRQLSKLSNQLAQIGDRNRNIYRSIGQETVTAWRSMLGMLISGAPLAGSAVSGLAGAATMLAGALYSAVQSAYGLAPLLAAIGVAAGTAAIGMNGFIAAVKSGDFKGLTPSAKSAALAIRSLSDDWAKLRNAVQERMFKGLSDDIRMLGSTLFPVLTQGMSKMAGVLNGLAKSMLDYVNSSAGLKQIGDLLDNSAKIFGEFSKAVVPALDGLLKLLNALAPAGARLATRIGDVAKKFQGWASAPGFAARIDSMMKKAETTAGLLLKVLGNLGRAITNVFSAANPATNEFLKMLGSVTKKFAEWSESVEGQKSIAKWASNSVDVMRQFGKTASSVFKVLSKLSDPQVIISFLETVQIAFDYLGKLPLEKMVTTFVQFANVLQPISGLFLAIIIAGASFNILLGSLIGQLGGFFSVLLKVATPLRTLFKPLESAGTHAKTLTGLSAAFARLAPLIGRIVKFIPFVGWAVYIGTLIAKSDLLKEKLSNLWDKIKGFGSSFKDAFKEVSDAIGPVQPALDKVGDAVKWVFDKFDELASSQIGRFFDSAANTFEFFGNVIRGAGKILGGFITMMKGIFSGDDAQKNKGIEKMSEGIRTVFSALKDWIKKNLLDLVKDALQFGKDMMAKFGEGIVSNGPSILAKLAGFIPQILTFFLTLPGRLAVIGAEMLLGFGQAIVGAIPGLGAKMGQIKTSIVNALQSLPGDLLTKASQAVDNIKTAIQSRISAIRTEASRIKTNVVSALQSLPGDLLDVAGRAIDSLKEKLETGKQKARNAVSGIPGAIKGALSDISLFSIGASIIGSLVSGLESKLDRLRSVARSIGSAIKGVVPGSPVEYGPLTAWNYGSGASGGGRNIIDAIASGLQDTTKISKAMEGVSAAVASSFGPTVSVSPTVQTRGGVAPVASSTQNIEVNMNNYGSQNPRAQVRELEWALRYAVRTG